MEAKVALDVEVLESMGLLIDSNVIEMIETNENNIPTRSYTLDFDGLTNVI